MPAIRLQRFLSQAGVAARRKGELMITAGRVKVNGRVVTELGTKVDPERDSVEVDGLRIATQKKYYYLLNKPKGYVTTVSDPEGRATVVELLPQLPTAIKPVGRLDFYTEGVLLLTNDGELQDALLSPRSDVKKTYHAKLRGEVPMADVEKLRAGVRITDNEGHSLMTMPAQVDVLRRTGVHTWLVITIREGRSRQIHRMAEALGYQVLKLARVSFAELSYHGLKIGECRPLTMREIHDLRRLAKLSPDVDVAPSPPAGIKREPAWKTGRGGGRSVTKTKPLQRPDVRKPDGAAAAAVGAGKPDIRKPEVVGARAEAAPRGDSRRPSQRELTSHRERRPDARPERLRRDRRSRGPDSRSPRPDSRSPRPDTRSPRADTRSPRADSRSPRADTRSPRTDRKGPRDRERTGPPSPRATGGKKRPSSSHRSGPPRSHR